MEEKKFSKEDIQKIYEDPIGKKINLENLVSSEKVKKIKEILIISVPIIFVISFIYARLRSRGN